MNIKTITMYNCWKRTLEILILGISGEYDSNNVINVSMVGL